LATFYIFLSQAVLGSARKHQRKEDKKEKMRQRFGVNEIKQS
jgi:hypothetical protein